MNKRRSRPTTAVSLAMETMESRVVLSAIGSAGGLARSAAEVAARAVHHAATTTKLTAAAGTLGQPITFTATVRAPAAAGSPAGTVNIIDHGTVIQTLTLSPTTSSGRYAYSEATVALGAQPGGGAYFFGKHAVSAEFVPSGTSFKSSTGKAAFTVSEPAYTMLSNGVEVETIEQGSGPGIQDGQTANMLYTGYLASTGQIFDDSLNHGGAPFSFTVGAGQVIPGFDIATAGMKVGETRIVMIPPSEGYGSAANGSIPANSTMIFVLTLQSIS